MKQNLFLYLPAIVVMLWGSSCVSTQSKVANPPATVHSTATPTANPEPPPLPADPCDNPEAGIYCCFKNIPDSISSTMQMVPKNETGARMRITGTLYQPNGRTPYPGVILYAYQADHNGYYRQSETDKGIIKQHGCLHGWCVTDSNGRYEIITIRPGKLPGKALPAQIHTAVQEPGRDSSFYIRDFVFSDDKLVSETYLKQQKLPGGDGVVKLKRDSSGTWTGKRDITLPKNKP